MKAVLHNVQVLRFVAAAMVLVSHLQHEVPSVRGLDLQGYTPWTPVFFAGGVDIFFVISGFIMMTIAADDFGRPGAEREFIVRRLLRVVPPYWLFTTAMLAAAMLFSSQVAHPQVSLSHLLASYFFLPMENPYGKIYPILILGWTLNFEMLFYVVFTVGLMFPRRWGVAVIVATISLLGLTGLTLTPTSAPFAFWCNPIVFEFLMGMGLAGVLQRGVQWSAAMAASVIAIGIAAMVVVMQTGIAGHHWLARALWMGLPACLVCAGAIFMRDGGALGPIRRFAVLAGDASFALYLSHPFTLAIVAALWGRTGITHPTAYLVVGSVASVAVSIGLCLWIERPAMAWLNRWVRGSPAEPRRGLVLHPLKEPHAQ